MRLERIVEAVYFRPWAITPEGWRSIHTILRPHLVSSSLPRVEAGMFVPGETDIFGNPLPEMLTMEGEVAIIGINGPLLQHAALIDKSCGACSYQDITAALDEASGMGVEKVLLNIDSPGGMCVGNQEVADLILDLRDQGMRIDAFGDSLICSAAFNIAAACDNIYLTRSAFAGCIGTILAVIDNSKEFAEAGLKVELFASGKYKGAGAEGLPLTEDHKAYFNGMKDKFAAMFKDNVRNNRPMIEEDAMEGQSLVGTDALDAGFVDEIVSDLDAALARVNG